MIGLPDHCVVHAKQGAPARREGGPVWRFGDTHFVGVEGSEAATVGTEPEPCFLSTDAENLGHSQVDCEPCATVQRRDREWKLK
jgi:hypothetical protein